MGLGTTTIEIRFSFQPTYFALDVSRFRNLFFFQKKTTQVPTCETCFFYQVYSILDLLGNNDYFGWDLKLLQATSFVCFLELNLFFNRSKIKFAIYACFLFFFLSRPVVWVETVKTKSNQIYPKVFASFVKKPKILIHLVHKNR